MVQTIEGTRNVYGIIGAERDCLENEGICVMRSITIDKFDMLWFGRVGRAWIGFPE